ncbi:nuclear transport factor 2 family protein [bacterium]|nr:nuclear transport factor 2 family protein [bacterium]
MSDDAAAVVEAARVATAAYCAGDTNAFLPYIHPQRTTFGPDGGRLAAFDAAALREGMAAGSVQAQVEWEDLQATVHGDVAVSTGYLVGTWTIGGDTRAGRWRETIVWLRGDDGWQVSHLHVSECLA